MPEIQHADPEARRRLILLTLVTIVVLIPIIFWLQSHVESFEDWLVQPGKTVERAKLTISVLVAIGAVLLLILAIVTFRFAGAVLRFEKYPPPNVKVIRDVRIRRGAAASWIGRLMQAYGVVVVLFLVSLIVAAWFLIQSVDQLAA